MHCSMTDTLAHLRDEGDSGSPANSQLITHALVGNAFCTSDNSSCTYVLAGTNDTVYNRQLVLTFKEV